MQSEPSRELMGHVRCPSGTVVILDAGLLGLWCHRDFNNHAEWPMPDETREIARTTVDLRIEGPDAIAAGKAFDRQWHPLYIYDIPADKISQFKKSFDAITEKNGLRAKLVALDHRIGHRERIDLALAHGNGYGEIQYHGMWAAVATGIPRDRRIPVYGERMTGPLDEGRWRRIYLELASNEQPTRSEFVGVVGVDKARLMFADADAIEFWEHDLPLDGMADVAFWGADEEKIAEAFGSSPLKTPAMAAGRSAQFGWVDLSYDDAAQKYVELKDFRDSHGLRAAIDFRPHSHHHVLLSQANETATESGTVTIGEAEFCGFFTSWGDGIFDVLAEHDATGRLVRLTIDAGNEVMVARQRRFEENWFGEFSKVAFVSNRVFKDSLPVGYLYREKPDREADSGWRVTAGTESQAFLDDHRNSSLVPLRELIRLDPKLEDHFRKPVGTALLRDTDGSFVPMPSGDEPGT